MHELKPWLEHKHRQKTHATLVMLPYLEGVYIFSGTQLYTQVLQQ